MANRKYGCIAERLVANTAPSEHGDCWLWLGRVEANGYGRINVRVGGRVQHFAAHRLAYETWRGPLTRELSVDHLCREPLCINPAHLEAISNEENARRSQRDNPRRPRYDGRTGVHRAEAD